MRGKGVSERGDAAGAPCLSVFVLEHVQVRERRENETERLCGCVAWPSDVVGVGGDGDAGVVSAERGGEGEREG